MGRRKVGAPPSRGLNIFILFNTSRKGLLRDAARAFQTETLIPLFVIQCLIFPRKIWYLSFDEFLLCALWAGVGRGESIIQIDKGKLGLPAGGRCYQPNAVIAWRILGEHTDGFPRLIEEDHRGDKTNCCCDCNQPTAGFPLVPKIHRQQYCFEFSLKMSKFERHCHFIEL